MSFEDIIYEKKEGTARLTINRPQVHNAVRFQTIAEIFQAMEDAESDQMVGVVVVTGEGDKSFCAGGDLSVMRDVKPESGRKLITLCLKLAGVMRNMGKPVIAAINGYCMGWGLEFLTFCDMGIAVEKSVFSQTEARIGSSPLFGATELFPAILGEKRAREAIFMARRYDAKEAERIGFINKVVPNKEALEKEVDAWCQDILDSSPQSIRLAKTSMNFSTDLLYPSLQHAAVIWTQINGSAEWVEGMSAFLEKRKPNYRKFRGLK